MKKSLFTVAFAVTVIASLVSCSRDTVLDSVSSQSPTKVSLVAKNCSSNYNVITLEGSNASYFYAYAPTTSVNLKAEITPARQILNVAVPSSDNGTDEDVIAAKALTSSTSQVDLNFEHLLSQIKFTAHTDSPALHVDIKSVGIENIYSEGTYDYDSESWTIDANSDNATYYTTINTSVTNQTVDLSGNEALLLIPQSGLEAWNKSADNSGARIAVLCKIKDNSGFQIYPATDDPSNDEDGYAMVYLPISPDWVSGESYTYNLVFGDTSAATSVYDANGSSILDGAGISFDPTVSSWTEISSVSNM
ncbi:MAG: fimbrillin family protein [Bacteroidales bacterium]|jgi:hypothetical protein|nr:fimbrillin family protein [Bacteroidales bacterium]MCI2121367.1 fimbrillin family protein [Bacteroidales bacterium]MCI2145514.1 fimbrillin family protein [Bacteroidales bacterium]